MDELMEAGDRFNNGNNGETPLSRASARGSLEVVKLLIAKGAKVNQARISDGESPLYRAVHYGHLGVAFHLLVSGAVVPENVSFSNRSNQVGIEMLEWFRENPDVASKMGYYLRLAAKDFPRFYERIIEIIEGELNKEDLTLDSLTSYLDEVKGQLSAEAFKGFGVR